MLTVAVLLLVVTDLTGVAAGASLDVGTSGLVSGSDPSPMAHETRSSATTLGPPLVDTTGSASLRTDAANKKGAKKEKGEKGGEKAQKNADPKGSKKGS
ncbi:MAG: hypothetical protein R3324_05065, partial [Halobacteriales archaeon]|nr:hypothetical protein [Halobacteriales archaeon]